MHRFSSNMRARWKVFCLAYNRRETQDKRQLGRDPDRSWCHHHSMINLSWVQPMPSWTTGSILIFCRRGPWNNGLWPKKVYTSVVVNPVLSSRNFHLAYVQCIISHQLICSYRNQFVTKYITYLNIWGVLSMTSSSLSTHHRLVLVWNSCRSWSPNLYWI